MYYFLRRWPHIAQQPYREGEDENYQSDRGPHSRLCPHLVPLPGQLSLVREHKIEREQNSMLIPQAIEIQ